MSGETRSARPRKLLATVVLMFLAVPARAAPQYKVLHAFGAGNDGAGLFGGVIFDQLGRLYGTTSGGGLYKYGTVWQLTPQTDGKWSETFVDLSDQDHERMI